MRFFFFCFFLIIAKTSYSKNIDLSLMAAAQTQSVFRGVSLWPDPQAMTGIGVTLFNHWQLRGPNLTYEVYSPRDKQNNKVLNFHLKYFDDNRPMIRFKSRERGFRNQRKNMLELGTQFEYQWGDYKSFMLGGFLGYEMIDYQNLYNEIYGGLPGGFKKTKLKLGLALAPKDTQQYLFGPEAKGGLAHVFAEYSHVIPKLPWDGIIMNSLESTWITSGVNKQADYVRGDSHNMVLATRWIWNFY
jgi:hypothetical protein